MADPVIISVPMRDVTSKSFAHEVLVSSATTVGDANSFVAEYLPLLDAVSGSVITAAYMRVPLIMPEGLKTAAEADYFNRQGGNLSFRAEDTTKRYTSFIPAYLRTLFSDENIPNTGATAALITYMLEMEDATTVGEQNTPLEAFLIGKLAKRAK